MPTYRQKLVASKISENIGKPVGQAMGEAGYSESTAETLQEYTNLYEYTPSGWN